jgi:hypothetical protein
MIRVKVMKMNPSSGVLTDEVDKEGMYLGIISVNNQALVFFVDDEGAVHFVAPNFAKFSGHTLQEKNNERNGLNEPQPVHGGSGQHTDGSINGSVGSNDSSDEQSVGRLRDSEEASGKSAHGVQSKGSGRNKHSKGNK